MATLQVFGMTHLFLGAETCLNLIVFFAKIVRCMHDLINMLGIYYWSNKDIFDLLCAG